MNVPRVSICLPKLNNFPHLAERIETIDAQTFKDWKLVICDNHSDDGAWEFFQELAARDSRVHISQEPREGMYANWNNCAARRAASSCMSRPAMTPWRRIAWKKW